MSNNLILVIGILALWLVMVRGVTFSGGSGTSLTEEIREEMDGDKDGEVSDSEKSDFYTEKLPDYTTGGRVEKEDKEKEEKDTYGYGKLPDYVTGGKING